MESGKVPEFAKRIWEREGPTCDCCGLKIPIEQVSDILCGMNLPCMLSFASALTVRGKGRCLRESTTK